MPKVLIIEEQVKQYRVPFYTKLHSVLQSDGVELKVAYSPPLPLSMSKGDNAELPKNFSCNVKAHWFADNKLIYQPFFREALKADLVIVDQGIRYLLNIPLLMLSRFGLKKVAFWGHGRNFQGAPNSLRERIKKHTVTWVDWWFAYTREVRNYVIDLGMPYEKVTTVNNSIDTTAFREHLAQITDERLLEERHRLLIDDHAPVGLYCGGLYPEKELDFLLEAAHLIRKSISNFHLLVVGGGIELHKIKTAMEKYPWIVSLGPRFDHEKALYFRMANVFLIPGVVGLAVLDAFEAGLSLVTTNIPLHGPEIEYLEDGLNGYIVPHNLEVYAKTVVGILQNKNLQKQLREEALKSARHYSIEYMVQNFRTGILTQLRTVSPS